MTTKIDLKNDPVLTQIVADRSAGIFEQKYPNLLACFDAGGVFSAIASVFRLDGGPAGDNFTVPNVVAATEDAFKKLLMRGALREFQRVPPPIPEAAQRELDKLFGIKEEDLVAEAQAAQSAQISNHQAQVQQCATDWRSLSTSDFKRKWPSRDHQETIEQAWALLEAQDASTANGYKNQRESREREANAALPRTY